MARKKGFKLKKIAFVLLIIGGIALVVGWKHGMAFLNGRVSTVNLKAFEIAIDNSDDLPTIAAHLKKNQIIDDTQKFLALAEYKNLTNEKIGSGKYRIEPETSYRQLLNGFTLNSAGNGNAEIEIVVTFNNCNTITDLSEKVAKCIDVNPKELEQFILSDATLSKYDFSKETIPALFMPNSYNMYYDTDVEHFVARMAAEFKLFWTAERLEKLNSVGLKSPSQAVTLASIVYGEQSRNKSEWPIIARLYLNRLTTGMRLQSDPTFKFCWEDQLKGIQRLTFEHRNKDCPYNTYLYAGLPPGPISMPPTGVVEAVLNPDENNYLFMCAQANYDGLHNFTKEYTTHAKNATEFQNWLAKELEEPRN